MVFRRNKGDRSIYDLLKEFYVVGALDVAESIGVGHRYFSEPRTWACRCAMNSENIEETVIMIQTINNRPLN